MVILNIIILLLFLAGYLISLKHPLEWMEQIDKKEHKLYFMYPLVYLIIKKTGLEKRLTTKSGITEAMKALHVTSKTETIQRLYWCSKLSMVIFVILMFQLLSLMVHINSLQNDLIRDGRFIRRPAYGEGTDEAEVRVFMEPETTEDTDSKKQDVFTQDMKIKVAEQSYNKKELISVFEDAIDYLETAVLRNNKSTDLIYDNLYFCSVIPGTSITVDWIIHDIRLIQTDGTVNNDDIPVKGKVTKVEAVLTYREEQIRHEITFRIMPKQFSEEEILFRKLEDKIINYSETTQEDTWMELPNNLEEYQLSWQEKSKNNGKVILFLGVFAAVIVWIYGDKELSDRLKKRKEQMLLDYPEIINKFTLLVNAGMTVKQAWTKITEDYDKQQEHNKKKFRYAYEEMKVTTRELKLGVSEENAYEQFGRRIGLIPYMKFGSLITQNIKKGNRGLSELLSKEGVEAFEERKESAKRLGEEAGTKLIVPMMIMLIIVFLMILIPAFQSMSI